MSRRSYIVNGTPGDKPQFLVTTGWDRPLQYFFLDILQLPFFQEGDEEVFIFNNLGNEKYPHGAMTLDDVRAELEGRRIPYPPQLFEGLRLDRDDPDTGQKEVTYRDAWMPLEECERLKVKAEATAESPPATTTDLF